MLDYIEEKGLPMTGIYYSCHKVYKIFVISINTSKITQLFMNGMYGSANKSKVGGNQGSYASNIPKTRSGLGKVCRNVDTLF